MQLLISAFVLLPATLFAAGKGQTAFLQSLVIPGWGQYSLGQKNAALAFFGAEAAMIGGMLALDDYGDNARDDYIAMARAYAGVSGEHSHEFYVDVGNWLNSAQFNEQRLRNREFGALYRLPDDQWEWESDEQRGRFKLLRVRSDLAYNNILYLVGGLVLNHVVAGIHAGRSAASREPSEMRQSYWSMNVKPLRKEQGAKLLFTYRF